MSRFTVVAYAVVSTFLIHASRLRAEDDGHTAALVDQLQDRSDAAASSAAFAELRRTLSSAPSETAEEIQARLCEAMRVSDDAWAIRRTALVLAVSPTEEAVAILAQRLNANPPPAMSTAICDGIHAFADRRPTLSPATASLALERLEALVRNRRPPGPLVDSAIMAMATFGSDGFERLMSLKLDATASHKIRNILHTALGETDDFRALSVLREAANDASNPEGQRVQAMHGLGQLFARAAAGGRLIDPDDRAACVNALKRHFDDATSDPVFASALKAAGHMVGMEQDSDLQQATLAALTSTSDARREAALEVLFQQDGLLASAVSSRVREVAQADHNPDSRATASAILEKQEALQTTLPSDPE